MKRIAVFTGTRAEYGLMYWLLKDLQQDPDLQLQLIVSGMHLSPEFGLTYRNIEQDGFDIDEKVEILLSSNTAVGTAKSVGLGVLGFADALNRLNPDIVVILGDRYEALAIAQTAMLMRIPVAHIHGGEITEGAYDDAIRHAISKLSYLHFTSNAEHRERVIQLGEEPSRVFDVGAVGLDHINRTQFLSTKQLSESLGFDVTDKYFVVTYHPETLGDERPSVLFQCLLDALDGFLDYKVILTYPNSDDGGREIIPMIEGYAQHNSDRVLAVPSLGQLRYLSAVKHASAVIGNSSSGIIEVPSFGVATVNIGSRQLGRMAASSVLHCQGDCRSIRNEIKEAVSFESSHVTNPYGSGDVSQKIIQELKSREVSKVKSFYNIQGNQNYA
jgi:UDP-hydrolysing UDP-N-acetyl-D-glucosamine 2-epimerase